MTARHTSQRISQRDRQVLDYLRFIADNEGTVGGSTYAIARELGMHRQTLSRVLQRLANTGAVVLEDHACTPVRVTNTVTDIVTNHVTNHVTNTVTNTVTNIGPQNVIWTITCTLPHIPRYVTGNTENVTLYPEIETFSPEIETQTVTDKKEKKQKKEKKPLTPACAREEISTKSDESRLERRRQRFVDALQPFTTRYGQEMITQFAEYWTEPNRSNTRMRFELQRTWNTSLRLSRWARNDYAFTTPSPNGYNQNSHNAPRRPTSEDYIRDAQEKAIADTEQFIREAELRRGGVPPHLPF